MTRPRSRSAAARAAALVCAVVVALLLGPVPAASAAQAPPGPESLGTPTPDQLEDSVRTWDPAEGDVHTWVVESDAVRQWVVTEDAVGELEEIVVDGTTTTITLSADVLFEFASDVVPEQAAAKIAELAAAVPQGATVTVDGHTDSHGGDAVNIDLSNRRAVAVAAALTASRPDLVLVATGHGSAVPVAAEGGEDDDAARALNRRVEISYTG